MNVTTGNVTVGSNGKGSVISENNVKVSVTKGNVEIEKSVEAKNGSVDVKTADGNIHIGNDPKADTVKAGQDVKLETEKGQITIDGGVSTANGDIRVKAARPTYNPEGNGENIAFGANGKLDSGNDAYLIAKNGDLEVKKNVTAKGTFYAQTQGQGNITLGENLTVQKDLSMSTETGNITVGKTVTAKQGSVSMTSTVKGDIAVGADIEAGKDVTATVNDGDVTVGADVKAGNNVSMNVNTGNVTVGSNGKGSVIAENDVTVTITQGAVDIEKSVNAKNGSVAVKVTKGDIHIGDDPNADDTVTAQQNVTLETGEGRITIDGGVSTTNGDIRVKAARPTYDPKGNGDNIAFGVNGKLDSGNDAYLISKNGDLAVANNVTAKGTFYAQTEERGNISLGENLTVQKDLAMITEKGNITVGHDITSRQGSVALQAGTGNVQVGVSGQGSVTAEKNIAIAIADGNLDIATSLVSNNGSVTAQLDKGSIHIGDNGPDVRTVYAKEKIDMSVTDGNIVVHGKTETAKGGDITMQAYNKDNEQNLVIEQNGKLISGRDLTMKTYNGNIVVTDATVAQRNLIIDVANRGGAFFLADVNVDGDVSASVKEGYVLVNNTIDAGQNIDMAVGTGFVIVGESVKAGQDIGLAVGTGNIYVGDDVTSENGGVKMQVGTGDITVGLFGEGSVTAEKDVSIAINEGNLDISTSLRSRTESVTAKIGAGDIHIGDNGPGVETVTAYKNVTLETEEGKIEVFGKTATETGDIKLKAASKEYVKGDDGHNIIIDHNGEIDSGNDATLVAKNGDLHVTHRIKAKNNISAITQNQGDIFLDRDIDATSEDSSVILRAEGKGNITASIIDHNDPEERRYKIKAGNRIEAFTGDGDITIGEAEAKRMSLVARGEDGHVTADRLLVHANGTGDVTGAANLTLGGSKVNVTRIENDGAAPLIISTVGGAAENRPVQDFNIGERVGDGTYTGGIRSASGAVIQQLWADRGMIYMADNSNLHMGKLVVNEKLHVANDIVSVGIYGVPPYHDGARVVYWNDAGKKNPSGMLDRWYNGSYIDPMWMYLDLDGSGAVGSRYGVLMDAHYYRNLHGDSVSMVDTMRIRMEPIPAGNGIYYFDRNNLIEIDDSGLDSDDSSSDAESEEITVELNYRNNVAGI